MYNPISWHIEPTTRCTLECPGCDRTWFKKTFGKQIISDINVDHLYEFFKHNNFRKQKIWLCGSNGDPIYHPNIIKLVEMLKSLDMTLFISTNGSAKTEKFWIQIGDILTEQDEVIFGIDGLEDTSKIYRINQKWNQVMTGVKSIVKSKAKCVWQFIPFNFNQHQIDEAKTLSKTLGVDKFKLLKSHRWLDDSINFKPSDNFIKMHRYDIQEKLLNEDAKDPKEMNPDCMSNQEIYITAEGNIFPCCHTATYRFRHKLPFGKDPINISNKNYQLKSTQKDFLETTKQWQSAHLVCKMHCSQV